MNFMYFCEVAKLSAWQMFSRDENLKAVLFLLRAADCRKL